MLDAFSRRVLLCATLMASLAGVARAAPISAATPVVRDVVDDAVTVTLTRDRPGALSTSSDEGALNDNVLLPHVHLALTRPTARQTALDTLVRDQQVRGATNFHHWLTPAQLRGYGPAQADVDQVVAWLTGHGIAVNSVSPSGMSMDFSGSVAKIASTFHTKLHFVLRHGEAHIANITAPSIPAALAPVVTGVTLSNFFAKPTMRRITPNLTVTSGKRTFYAVTPSDFATIYNVKPLRGTFNFYHAPITGKGVTLAVVEQTQIQTADWVRFRQAFGLAGYAGTLTQSHPGNCTSPGTTPDEGEAALDAEWSSAVAPDANIIEASCAGTAPFEFGVYTALQNLVEVGTPASVFSISYGGPELGNGFAFISAWTNLLQEGAAEGKSIFVSSGDSGSSADRGSIDSNGLDINGLSDSAYNVSVGGTDFYDTALGQNAAYWHQTNGAFFSSAISYVPEIAWDNACSNAIIWNFYKSSGPIAFCNSSAGTNPKFTQNGVGGGGGQSDYYTKPYWQLTSVLGVPNDGVRDQPDVSLFAANGIWNHFYVFCMSDATQGGSPCTYQTANEVFGNAAGGTSFAAPAFAGIQALVQQTFGATPLGNPAPEFYRIARAQFTTPLGFSRCNATLGNEISRACVFNYVTKGDNTEPCYAGSPNCEGSTGALGVLGTMLGGKNVFAFPAQPGYSLATGLGTVNVTNLLYNYNLNY